MQGATGSEFIRTEDFQEFESAGGEENMQQGGGLLKAIGETIVEIGKTATDLIAGRGHVEESVKHGEK